MFENARAWWEARSGRERRLSVAALAMATALAAYALALRPAWDARVRAEAEFSAAREYLGHVDAEARAVRQLTRRANAIEPMDAGGLRTTAAAVAVAAGVEIQRLQPLDGGVVEFWFEQVEARRLFAWIVDMRRRYGAVVVKADVNRSADGGLVGARIALQAVAPP